jgi:hypothetical protein
VLTRPQTLRYRSANSQREESPMSTRIAILDDGVARSTIDTSTQSTSKLATGPAGTLFGFNGMSSGYNFTTYAVSATGVMKLFDKEGLMFTFQNDIHYNQGRVYGDYGEVVDVGNPAQPFRVGKYAFHGVITARSANRMLMLTEGASSDSLQVRILETDNFTQVASLPLGKNFSGGTTVADFVYLGGDGVAFLGGANDGTKDVFILRSPALATVP